MFKKCFLFFFLALCLLAQGIWAEETTGQTHKLGFKAGLFSPTGDKSKVSGIEAEIQFDAKIHPHVDAGPHFGIFLKSVKDNITSGEDTKFVVVPITMQFRFYPFYTQEKGSTHGIFAPFLSCSAGYYFALLSESNVYNVQKVPDGVGGFGGTVGAGLDLGFGPSTAYFVEANYRICGIRSIGGYDLNLNGYTLSIGARF